MHFGFVTRDSCTLLRVSCVGSPKPFGGVPPGVYHPGGNRHHTLREKILESASMPTLDFVKKSSFLSPTRFWGLGCLALLCGFAAFAQTPESAPLAAPSANSQEVVPQTPGSITGRVVDQTGVYIGGAQV